MERGMLPQSLSVFTPGHSEWREKDLFILSYSSLMGTPNEGGHTPSVSFTLHSWTFTPSVSLTVHSWAL